MKNSSWPWVKNEPELQNLRDWLDTEGPRQFNQKEWGLWGGITGTIGGLAGGMTGMLAGSYHVHSWFLALPLTAAVVVSAVSGGLIVAKQRKTNVEIRRAFAEAKGFTGKLVSARFGTGIKTFIGEERALLLNEAAGYVLACHNALDAVGWQSAPENSDYASVRNRVRVAVDIAMMKMVSLIGRGALTENPEVRELIEEMKFAAQEATRTANQLSCELKGSSEATDELRQAISEMRSLNQAQEEFQRMIGPDC